MRAEIDDEQERQFWRTVFRIIGTLLIVVSVLGALSVLTVLLGWSRHLLLGGVGLAAGVAISIAAAGSARSRRLTALLLGTLTLPALAAHVAASSDADYAAYGARLAPFLAHAAAAVLVLSTIAALWRRMPDATGAPAEEPAPQGSAEPRGARVQPVRSTTRGAIP